MDNQSRDDKNLNRQPDRPKEGDRPHNPVSDAEKEQEREKQQRERDERERNEKNKQADIQEPPKTKTATP